MEKKSSIIAIGLTIHNTPVEIREKLAIPEVSILHHACLDPSIQRVPQTCACLGLNGMLTTELVGYFRLSGPEPSRSYARSLTLKRQQCCPLATEWSCML